MPSAKRRRQLRQVRARLHAVQGGRCFYCGRPMGDDVTRDHFIPRACCRNLQLAPRGFNSVLAHKRCNERKGDRWPTAAERVRFAALVDAYRAYVARLDFIPRNAPAAPAQEARP